MNEFIYNPFRSDHLRERADACDAALLCEPIERMQDNGKWTPAIVDNPERFLSSSRYRRAPAPKTRPWSKPEDVPGPVCWIRRNEVNAPHSDNVMAMIVNTSDIGFEYFTRQNGFVNWCDVEKISSLEHSTDRKTWLPCTVIEP